MNGFKLSLLAGAALAVAGIVAPAGAVTITQSVQFGPGPTDYTSATGPTTLNGSSTGGTTFAYFDSTLGTLNSITFSSSYGFTSSISITNTSATNATGNARTQSAAQFQSNTSAITAVLNNLVNNLDDAVDGNAVQFGNQTLTPIAYDVRGSRSSYTLTPGNSTSFTSTGTASTTGVIDTNASDLSAFSVAGGGNYTPLFNTLSGLVISNSGGNVNATQTTTATGTLTIAYNYTAAVVVPPTSVPEPASLALLGAGLLGIGMIRRKSA